MHATTMMLLGERPVVGTPSLPTFQNAERACLRAATEVGGEGIRLGVMLAEFLSHSSRNHANAGQSARLRV